MSEGVTILQETMLKTTTGADDLRAKRGSDQEAIKEREREDHTKRITLIRAQIADGEDG